MLTLLKFGEDFGVRMIPKGLRQMMVATNGIANLTQPKGNHIEHAAGGIKGHFLIEARDSDAIGESNVAIIGNDASIDQFKQR